MRFSLFLLSLLASSVASLAWADDITVNSRVTEVTVYPMVAAITRHAEFDLPIGQHRLILSNIPYSADLETLQMDLTGARQTAVLFREDGVPPRRADDPEVLAAEAVIKEVETRIQAVRDEASRAESEAAAAQTAIGFLQQLGSNEGLAEAGAEALRDITRMIATEAGAAGKQALEAQIRARAIEDQLEDLAEELKDAERALAAIAVEDANRYYLVIEVDVTQAGPGKLELNYFTSGYASSQPSYEWHLNTGETPELELKRGFNLWQETGENWSGIDLTISTLVPGERGTPSHINAQQRWLQDPRPEPKMRSQEFATYDESQVGLLAEPIVEPIIMEEAAGGVHWGADTSGPGATYQFSHPVSIASGPDILKLEMDSLTTEAELLAVAVPMRDETAYRVAKFTNDFDGDLLESHRVPMFVDGKLVTFSKFERLAVGQEAELGFGALHGLRLTRDVLQKSEGERGVISRSNQQEEVVEISVANLTGETWPLRLLDRVPYSEQEDLEITWSAQPSVSEENVDKQRGILAWEFDLAPGEDKLIRLETTLSWPEGKLLR
ncbi:hypothetical protein MED193_11494 [Roseobacter sp. MED193]|uniref:DUF4139 domain-containing protein n=1 Tax=Roseobacter sp. MED193 TaxID=314262 RepID=UPI000068A63C|nr:DUF4139 domain-containing protein [Roseobacter sp. MED193]EAQ43407.1 hypothetical protein MED193_11494 [Roseobacter sp. MED193]